MALEQKLNVDIPSTGEGELEQRVRRIGGWKKWKNWFLLEFSDVLVDVLEVIRK